MKAVIVEAFGPVGDARVAEVPETEPGPGEVCISMRAADINYPDILVMEGLYQVKPPLPFSPGKAGVGVIESVGEGVTTFTPGDRVAAEVEYGAYTEQLVCAGELCCAVPEGISFETAAALTLAYQTGYYALIDRASFKAGDTVLVLGATGAVGMACVQLAKALGASTVLAGVRTPDKAQIARNSGADGIIDLGMDDLRDGLRAAVHEATNGHGADVVIDPVGGGAHAAALRAMAWRGRMVIVGFASGDIPQIRSNYLLVKNITVSGLQWSDYRQNDPEGVRRAQEHIFELALTGKLKPHIGRVFEMEEFAEALELLKQGRSEGKFVMRIGEDRTQ